MVRTAERINRASSAVTERTKTGAFIEAKRKKQNMSRSDLARELFGEIETTNGYRAARSRHTIGTWETGQHLPKPEILPLLAEKLGVDLDELQKRRYEDATERSADDGFGKPDIMAGTVAGRPDLIRMTAKLVVPLADLPRIMETLTTAASMVSDVPTAPAASKKGA
jgi:transcriptional regulator with XRE-family HTH domain